MPTDELYFDEDTLLKVRVVLTKYICGHTAITDCITELQNEGIFFRERVPEERVAENVDVSAEQR